MIYKYGNFNEAQMSENKKYLRKQIFFLMLLLDPDNQDKDEYKNIDIDAAFLNLQKEIDGLNSLLSYPKEIVSIASLLEAAFLEFKKEDFNWNLYRKLILDAGAKVLKIKEV